MKVFVARMCCGDYYCKEEHIIGVYSTKELAEAAQITCDEHENRWLQVGPVEELDLNPTSPRTYKEASA